MAVPLYRLNKDASSLIQYVFWNSSSKIPFIILGSNATQGIVMIRCVWLHCVISQLARVNHSCSPNAEVVWNEEIGTLDLRWDCVGSGVRCSSGGGCSISGFFCGGGCNSVGFSNQIKSNQIKGFYCKST